MKIGVELKIDVTKIDKSRLFTGKKGTYLTMTAFIDLNEKDQYGNSGMITHEKKEGEDRSPILGNSKIFWSDAPSPQESQPVNASAPQQMAPQAQGHGGFDVNEDEDIPF